MTENLPVCLSLQIERAEIVWSVPQQQNITLFQDMLRTYLDSVLDGFAERHCSGEKGKPVLGLRGIKGGGRGWEKSWVEKERDAFDVSTMMPNIISATAQ